MSVAKTSSAAASVGRKSFAELVKGHTATIPQAAKLTESIMNLSGMSSYREIPVNRPHPDAPAVVLQEYAPVETRFSKLANGVTVVSRDTHDVVSVVGAYIDAGSRYLTPQLSGAPHFLESISQEATENRTALNVCTELQKAGANLTVQANRDGFVYQCELFRNDVDFGLGMIGEIIREPAFEEWNFDKYRQEYLYRRGDDMANAERQLPEMMHKASWQANTLGLPLWCDEFTAQNMTPDSLRDFLETFVRPSRIVIGGVGVEHEHLEDLAKNYFGDLEDAETDVVKAKARYTGGEIRQNMNTDDGFTHVAVCFETENWHSKDLMAMCTLNMMMGGGGHFSAGGPGKGMFTRIYQEALGRYGWLNGLHCSHSIYEDSAIFAYYGTALPENGGDLTKVIADQAMGAASRKASKEELERAKTALATNICFDFEDRQVVFEDICRQVQVYGAHKTPDGWRDAIMAVTADDVQRVAQKMLQSKLTLVAAGADISTVPIYDDVVGMFK